jgi:formylglycine-generating enzyme
MTSTLLRPPSWASYWGEDEFGPWVSLVISDVEQRFRFIQPGEFMMGSPETEPERYENEVQHKVRLTKGYWLADSACTQSLWKAVMKDNPSNFKGDELPVEEVSWTDTQTFLESLNTQLGRPVFRLPSEAEWEYACRAKTDTPFSFGNTINSEQVNFDGNHPYNKSKKSAYREQTVPVKSLPCNDWGLYEMHGNVWEWCKDWYGDYDTTKSVVINPEGPLSGDFRVLRGGSWLYFARFCRSAYRLHFSPVLRSFTFGFRFASGHLETE